MYQSRSERVCSRKNSLAKSGHFRKWSYIASISNFIQFKKCSKRRERSSCSRHEVEMDYGYSELQFSPAVGMKYQRKGEVLRNAVASDTEADWEGAWRDQRNTSKRLHNIKHFCKVIRTAIYIQVQCIGLWCSCILFYLFCAWVQGRPSLILDIDSKIQLVVVELSPHAHFNYTFSIHKATHFVWCSHSAMLLR